MPVVDNPNNLPEVGYNNMLKIKKVEAAKRFEKCYDRNEENAGPDGHSQSVKIVEMAENKQMNKMNRNLFINEEIMTIYTTPIAHNKHDDDQSCQEPTYNTDEATTLRLRRNSSKDSKNGPKLIIVHQDGRISNSKIRKLSSSRP